PTILSFPLDDPDPTESYPLSLHDALPISPGRPAESAPPRGFWDNRLSNHRPRAQRSPSAAGPERSQWSDQFGPAAARSSEGSQIDRKSTRLNSSHDQISYAVFCLKKKTMR